MTYRVEIDDDDFGVIEVEFEADQTPYLPATWDYPAEGGIESIYDAVIVESDLEDEDSLGPSATGLKLSDAFIDEHMDAFVKAVEDDNEVQAGEAQIEAYLARQEAKAGGWL